MDPNCYLSSQHARSHSKHSTAQKLHNQRLTYKFRQTGHRHPNSFMRQHQRPLNANKSPERSTQAHFYTGKIPLSAVVSGVAALSVAPLTNVPENKRWSFGRNTFDDAHPAHLVLQLLSAAVVKIALMSVASALRHQKMESERGQAHGKHAGQTRCCQLRSLATAARWSLS